MIGAYPVPPTHAMDAVPIENRSNLNNFASSTKRTTWNNSATAPNTSHSGASNSSLKPARDASSDTTMKQRIVANSSLPPNLARGYIPATTPITVPRITVHVPPSRNPRKLFPIA